MRAPAYRYWVEVYGSEGWVRMPSSVGGKSHATGYLACAVVTYEERHVRLLRVRAGERAPTVMVEHTPPMVREPTQR